MLTTRSIYNVIISTLAFTAIGVQAQDVTNHTVATTVADANLEAYHPAVIDTVTAKPVNAGINPNYAALEITGRILLGTNPCRAKGVKAKLQQSQEGDVIVVTALRDDSAARRRMCTMEYNPQYTQVSTSVIYNKNTISDIRVRNVDALGDDQSAFDLSE